MSIFTTRKHKTSVVEENSVPVIEGYEFETDGYIDAFMESYDDDLAIMEAMHKYDMLSMLFEGSKKDDDEDKEDEEDEDDDEDEEDDEKCAKESTGVPEGNSVEGDAEVSDSLADAYNKVISGKSSVQATLESAFKDIGKSILSALDALWGKLKSYFNSAKAYFDSYTKSGQEFVKLYGDKVKGIKGYKHKMFNYNNSMIDSIAELGTMSAPEMKESINVLKNIKTMTDEQFENAKQKIEDDPNSIIPGLFKSTLKIDVTDEKGITETIKFMCRGRMEEKELLNADMEYIVSVLSKSDNVKKLNAAIRSTNEEFSQFKTLIDRAIKELKNEKIGKERIALVNKVFRIFKTLQNYKVQTFTAYKSMVVERDGEYKKACIGALSYAKKEAKNGGSDEKKLSLPSPN